MESWSPSTKGWPVNIRGSTTVSRPFAWPGSRKWTGVPSSSWPTPSWSANAESSPHTRSETMRARRLFLLATLLMAAAADAGTRIDLNRGWSFRVESGVDGVQAGWPASMPEGVTTVDVPHTWNRTGPDYAYLG